MPLDFTPLCKQILHDIVTTSDSIHHFTFAYANCQNLEVSERLRGQLGNIRASANAILAAITRASLTDYTTNDRLNHWLIFSGEPQECLRKLKEIINMFGTINHVRAARAPPLTPGEDKLTTAMVFFDRHKALFHSLITPDVWNREGLLHKPSDLGSETQAHPLSGTECHPQETSSVIRVGQSAEPNTDQALAASRQKESHHRQLEEVLKWLAALNCTDKHDYLHQLRQDGTCNWFPNTDEYTKWRRLGAQFLWLHGKAGCGKSVLVASTIEHLKGTLQFQEVVVFFYFDFQNERSRSPVEMMRSLLSQLCRHLLNHDIDPWTFGNKILEEKGKGCLTLDDLDKLCDLVSCAADRFVREPIVVIDALDECADIESLLCVLLRLWHDDKVRLLVTSRPHHKMTHHFTTLPSLSFEDVVTELAADIELHVMQEASHVRLNFASPEMKKELHAKLIQKAEGRFRWVQCQLDVLKRCTTSQELRKALDNLPNELETTYERILDGIDERRLEGKLARRVLAWLMVALEPLRLVQILDSLSVDFLPPGKIDSAGLIDMLSSLISHYKETDVVSLSHFSVKEYLTARTTLPMYQITLCEAHAEAAQSCMRYISAVMKQTLSHRSIPILESRPMLSYALSSGFNHLAHGNPESTVVLEALQALGSDVRHHPSHWDCLCRLREEDLQLLYPPWPSSRHDFVLYILIAYASVGLFQTFLSGHHPVKPRVGTNPLVYAADLRRTNHGIALSACCADVNALGLAIDDSHHISPLQVAVDRDEDALVGELLQRGCSVTPELLSTAICLPWCSVRVLVKLVHTHEFEEWAHAIGDEKLFRGVFSSARPNAGDIRKADKDRVALARRLREIGQDLSSDSRFGSELVERALYAAHTSMLDYLLPASQPPPPRFLLAASTGDTPETVPVVRFLLRKGADINVVSARGDTILHLAARCPWEPRSLELTRMFVHAGCNPYTLNSRRETSLTIAVNHGYHSVVEQLLSSDYLLPPTTLSDALLACVPPRMIALLVRGGADVHSTTSEREPVLLTCVKYNESECLELVEIFIKAGCDINRRNRKRKTPLHAAIERDYTSVVELLLSHNALLPPDILPFALEQPESLFPFRNRANVVELLLSRNVLLPPDILPFTLKQQKSPRQVETLIRNGADVHSTSLEGDSVFDLAIVYYSESTYLKLAEIFIKAGCDINRRNPERKTALHAAIERDYTSMVELLLSHNVLLPPDILPFALERCKSPRLVQILIRNGANVQPASVEGKSIFHLAITHYSEFTCLKLVEIFIKAGCDPNIYDFIEGTVLDAAMRRGYDFVVKSLLSHNVQLPPDIPFALQQRSSPQLVQFLIHNGANVHSTSSKGENVFHLAIAHYNESMCLELVDGFVKAGCDINIRNPMGETVLHAAIKRGYVRVVAALVFLYNVQLSPRILPFAIQQVERETTHHIVLCKFMCLLLVKNIAEAASHNTESRHPTGKTVPHSAIEHEFTFMAKVPFSYDIQLPPDILPFALQHRWPPQLVRILIRNGAGMHSTSEGETVFHLAIANYDESTCLELVGIFIEAGGNPNIWNSKGETVLRAAIRKGYTASVVKALRLSGV